MGLDRAFYRSALDSRKATAQEFEVKFQDFHMALVLSKGASFALLDTRTAKSLSVLQAVQHLHFMAAILLASDVSKTPNSTTTCEVTINIYGPKHSSQQVGALLTEERRYLQHPHLLEFFVEYINPHFLVMPGTQDGLGQYVKTRYYGASSKAKITSEVNRLLESLDLVADAAEPPVIHQLQTPLLS